MAMCWRMAGWCSTGRPARWARTRTSRSSISASPKANASRFGKASTIADASAGWPSLPSPPDRRTPIMRDHFDSLETREPDERERDLLGRLPDLVALALRAPGWSEQLKGIEPGTVTSRAALARLPLLRKSDLAQLQRL